jgi:hypothetical protein
MGPWNADEESASKDSSPAIRRWNLQFFPLKCVASKRPLENGAARAVANPLGRTSDTIRIAQRRAESREAERSLGLSAGGLGIAGHGAGRSRFGSQATADLPHGLAQPVFVLDQCQS